MKRIAIIAAVLEKPMLCHAEFNEQISSFQGIVKGRLGIPLEEYEIAAVSLTVIGTLDQINSLTGKLGKINGITVKTAISNRQLD